MDVFIEPLEPPPALYIFGAGHVGYHLARVAHGRRLPRARRRRPREVRQPRALPRRRRGRRRRHSRRGCAQPTLPAVGVRGGRHARAPHDLDALRALAPRELRYLGLIGSRAKVARIYDALLAEGHAAPSRSRACTRPIGLDIGAVTPQEIAVSILAELIAVRRGKAQGTIADASLRWMPQGQSSPTQP